MRLAHPELDFYIDEKENSSAVLVIENENFLYKLLLELKKQIDSGDGRFVFSEEFDIVSAGRNVFLITDLLDIELNKKKILSKIYSDLAERATGEENYEKTARVLSALEDYISDLTEQFDAELEYSLPSPDSLLKMFNVKVEDEERSLVERLIDYISLLKETFNIRYFVIFGLHSFLSKEDLIAFYNFTFLKKYAILSVEHVAPNLLECEKTFIVDSDLCSFC